jgi:hypothetical protein
MARRRAAVASQTATVAVASRMAPCVATAAKATLRLLVVVRPFLALLSLLLLLNAKEIWPQNQLRCNIIVALLLLLLLMMINKKGAMTHTQK